MEYGEKYRYENLRLLELLVRESSVAATDVYLSNQDKLAHGFSGTL